MSVMENSSLSFPSCHLEFVVSKNSQYLHVIWTNNKQKIDYFWKQQGLDDKNAFFRNRHKQSGSKFALRLLKPF